MKPMDNATDGSYWRERAEAAESEASTLRKERDHYETVACKWATKASTFRAALDELEQWADRLEKASEEGSGKTRLGRRHAYEKAQAFREAARLFRAALSEQDKGEG